MQAARSIPGFHERPLDAFLLYSSHPARTCVLEKLLQFLIGEVDAQLLQAVILTSKT